MSTIYFTPGPTQLFSTYRHHLMEAMDKQLGSINHRSNAFRSIYQHTDEQLRMLMNIPSTHSIFFASSATEIWEKLLLNCVENYSFHLTNGSFSSKFYEFAKLLKKSPEQYTVTDGNGFDMHEIAVLNESELICTTQNETSTGVQIPISDLFVLKEKYPHQLLCTDLVSTAPYAAIDYSWMDCAFFSVQKAFGMPPGLGVWMVNEHCLAKAEMMRSKGFNMGAHNTLESYAKNYVTFETPSTPNIIAIYILGKIAEDMNRIGITAIRQNIDEKAEMIYAFAQTHTDFIPFVKHIPHRSQTIAVYQTKKPSDEINELLRMQGMVVGSGYGKHKATQIRIANFPSTTVSQMARLLDALHEI